MHTMRFVVASFVILTLSSAGHPAAKTTQAPNQSVATRPRIGTFDSRMVALAYYNTPEFQKEMQQMRADLTAAKAAKNQAKVDELEFQGPAIQSLLHYQVFSNASIPNVLEKISADLPKVAAAAGVSALVSKWDIAFKNADVEYVDVTDRLVRLFNPTPRVLQMISQAGTQPPLPLMEAVKTLRPDR